MTSWHVMTLVHRESGGPAGFFVLPASGIGGSWNPAVAGSKPLPTNVVTAAILAVMDRSLSAAAARAAVNEQVAGTDYEVGISTFVDAPSIMEATELGRSLAATLGRKIEDQVAEMSDELDKWAAGELDL